MILYRATFLRHGSTPMRPAYRMMTFAARDPIKANADAMLWTCGDKLLSVEPIRELQPQLVLT